ncbi:vanadium-dependent haloperoxidase [Flavihumibacter sp. CACIAM 22H1]|uniref:vanadium-dependent haloperoxidase n=1 Tax=Flavihumibacter sp. CACIAM 22H1 TaxID=1812911 RepID=UPI0007A91090|nr:vanadium-dependent haloperoxidase [Flavihumibacter sp. CACIAM 22H1]KYP14758.1 MAG: haloperoxidase [Flavihumibacter sp. CACIAM 22H1]
MRRLIPFVLLLVSLNLAAQSKKYEQELQPAVFSLTMVMMHDVINPPAAARFYTYCTLGAYDLLSKFNKNLAPPSASFRRYTNFAGELDKKKLDPGFTAIYSIYLSGISFLPSGFMLEQQLADFEAKYRLKGMPDATLQYSKEVAKKIVAHVMEFSKKDNYNKLSTKLRYSPSKGEGNWYPTPPAYMEAVEPNWKIIRPMLLDSGEQCKPKPPIAFSKDSSSPFHQMALEVYRVGNSATREQKEIAAFWDCNPFAITSSGHMNVGFKKISPGGHWMNIASIASLKAGLPLDKAVQVQSLTAATLMDAFISCWEEKYRSNRIRPETYINRHVDAKWMPLLQTPPFPEYTSGHSVVSGAVAELLTYFFGDHFAYEDDTELMFELPARQFSSFRQAAEEAAISRLYGGIHFRDAVEYGVEQGRAIGTVIVSSLKSGSSIGQRTTNNRK